MVWIYYLKKKGHKEDKKADAELEQFPRKIYIINSIRQRQRLERNNVVIQDA